MLRCFAHNTGQLATIDRTEAAEASTIWYDLLNPDPDEDQFVEKSHRGRNPDQR